MPRYTACVAEYLNDHPTYADPIGRLHLLKEVGEHIQACRPPQVVGVFGDWGSGKTSFMRSLQLYLAGVHSRPDALAITTKQNRSQAEEKEFNGIKRILDAENSCKGYPVIWFEAWLYQAEDVPIVALLHEIRRQFSPGSQFWEMLTVSGRTALEASLLMLDPLAKAIEKVAPMASLLMHAVGSVAKASEKVERDRFEVPLSSDQIRVQLNQAVKTILGNFKKESYNPAYFTVRGLDQPEDIPMPRLTIIIDDLDRCEPAMAIRLLEGLKIFLNIEHCVFVLGVNPRRLTDHIANLYRNEAKAAASDGDKYTFAARDYLDKIIGAHFTLGVAGNTSKLIEDHMPTVVLDLAGTKKPVTEELKQVLLNHRCLPPNPRRIKAFLATLARFNDRRFSKNYDPGLLISFAYLNHFHPEIIRKMQYYQGFDAEFIDWTSRKNETGSQPDELNAIMFDGVLPHPEFFSGQPEKGRSKYPDPIYENVLHVHSLFREWEKANTESYIAWKVYVDERQKPAAPVAKVAQSAEILETENLAASAANRESFFNEYFLLG